MFTDRLAFPTTTDVEEELFPLFSSESQSSNAMQVIRQINEEIFEKYEQNLRKQQETQCCIRYKEPLIASGCGFIAVIVMAVWAAKTLPGELRAILEPSLHGGYHGPIGHNTSHPMNQTMNDQLSSNDESSSVSIPSGVIIYPIVKFTASAHVVGQAFTWAAEWVGIKKPALSLKEYKLLSKAVSELSCQPKPVFKDSEVNESDTTPFKNVCNISVVTGKRILCHQKKTYLQIGVYITFLTVEALLIYYIWILASKSINGISEAFLKGLANKNHIDSSANSITPYRSETPTETELATYHTIRNMTHESTAHLESEMYGPIEKTLAVGVFTALTPPTVTLLSKIPRFVKDVYRRCWGKEGEEPVEFHDVTSVTPLVVDFE